jgi:hypothetical protein
MKYPVFVLEGADCTGKSTMAEVLVRKTGAHYIHSTYRWKGRMGAYHWAQLRKAVRLAETKPVVMDRWWPSEVVYGNVYRNGPEKGYDWRELHHYADLLGFSYTFCLPLRWDQYWEFAKEHYHNQDQMYKLDEARINFVWMNYRDMMIDAYRTFDRERLHYYNVVLDRYRCNMFANHIITRWKGWMSQQSDQRKELIRSTTWRDVHPKNIRKEETAGAEPQLRLL